MDLLTRNSRAVFFPCEIGIEIPDLPVNPSCKDILHQQCNDIYNDFFTQRRLLCDILLHIAVCLLVVDGFMIYSSPFRRW